MCADLQDMCMAAEYSKRHNALKLECEDHLEEDIV